MTRFAPAIRHHAPRVALLVDGENLSCSLAEALIAQAARHGDLIIRRVYGNVARLNGWCAVPGVRVMHSGTGKNATDLLLAVEAMALMVQSQADILVLASSDGDFTHLAQHLTEAGKTVIGLGLPEAPERFRRACSAFHDLSPPAPRPLAPPGPDPVVAQARGILALHPQGMLVTDLCCALNTLHQIRISATPHKTWRAFLTAHPALFTCDPKGPAARVRLTA